jgi:quercetin dioxygenase-like cupin family protein
MLLRLLPLVPLLAAPHAYAQPAAPGEILRQGTTVSGQKLRIPKAPELVVSVRELPPGGAVPVHKHKWQRYAYVERGRIRIVNRDTGATREFAAGEVVVEPIGQWHEGRVVGDSPVRLIVFDQVPKGETNMVLKEPR